MCKGSEEIRGGLFCTQKIDWQDRGEVGSCLYIASTSIMIDFSDERHGVWFGSSWFAIETSILTDQYPFCLVVSVKVWRHMISLPKRKTNNS